MASTHQLKIQDIFSVKDYVCMYMQYFMEFPQSTVFLLITFHLGLVTGGGTGIGLMVSLTRLQAPLLN